VEKTFGAEVAAMHEQEFDKFQKFFTECFAAEALAALAADPMVEDVALARQFLDSHPCRPAAIQIIVSKKTAVSVDDLIDIARSTYGDERKMVLDAVRRFSVDKLETARILLLSQGRDMHRAAVSLISDLHDEDALPFLEELLSHESGDLRVAAVAQLRKRVDRARLAEILAKYTDQATYFYSVVVWLDRLVYAPVAISGYYETELDAEMKAQLY
jgi:hypothetical protein